MSFNMIDKSSKENKKVVRPGDLVFYLDKIYRINGTMEGLFFVMLNGSNCWNDRPLIYDNVSCGNFYCDLESVIDYFGDRNLRIVKADDYNITLEILR